MSEQTFRPIRGVLLDASIPVIRIGSDSVANLHTALDKNKGKESTWSHAQVAVPKDKLNLKALGFEKTRFAIPLPGESWGTPSYRHGELHAHEAGPFLLVHKDESAPGSGLFAHLVKDVPEALRRRFSGKIAPFVQEKPMIDRELQKAAMLAFVDEYQKIADSTFTTSQYAGPMGGGSFQQASQLPAFKAPGLRTAIEKPQQKIAAGAVRTEDGKEWELSELAQHYADRIRIAAGIEKDAAPRVGKLPAIFNKEKGIIGRAGQLLSGERSLALKTYKERYEGHAGRLARKAQAHENSGSPEYASSLRRDAELTGRAAGRIGKIHKAEAAKSTAARAGVVGAAGAAGFAAGKIHDSEKEAGALTPAGRLVATQRKATGMGASVSGPSIAEVSKPPSIGHAMPGALKNRI